MSPPPAQRRGRLGVQTPCNPYPTLPHASESTTPPSARPQWRARADQPRTGARQAAPQRASQAGFGRRLQQGPCPSERTAAATAHTGRSERARGTGTYWQACSGASGARGAHAPAHAPQQQAAGRAPAPHNTRAVGRARAWRRPRCRPASPRASAARAGPPAGRPGRRRGSRPSRPAPRPRRSTPRHARAAAGRRRRAPAPRRRRRAPPPAPRPPALPRAHEILCGVREWHLTLDRPFGACGALSAMRVSGGTGAQACRRPAAAGLADTPPGSAPRLQPEGRRRQARYLGAPKRCSRSGAACGAAAAHPPHRPRTAGSGACPPWTAAAGRWRAPRRACGCACAPPAAGAGCPAGTRGRSARFAGDQRRVPAASTSCLPCWDLCARCTHQQRGRPAGGMHARARADRLWSFACGRLCVSRPHSWSPLAPRAAHQHRARTRTIARPRVQCTHATLSP